MLNKWVLIDEGDHYHAGQITGVCGEYVLVRIGMLPTIPKHMRLFSLEQLAVNFSAIFDDEGELNAFLAWLDGDSGQKLKVVPIGAKKSE